MPEYGSIGVREETKERYSRYRRQIEAARDEDMTDDEFVRWLLEQAPDPETVEPEG